MAAVAIARRLGVPRRSVAILEGESLFNDATALVIYKIALGVVAGESFSLLHATGQFLVDAAGGIAIGLVAGVVISAIRRRIEDPLVENTISLLSGYAAYVPAERAGVSAVLAAVTCGIYVGWQAPLIASPATRVQGFAMWELLRLPAQRVPVRARRAPAAARCSTTLGGQFSATAHLAAAALVGGVVILTRLLWQHTIVFVIRALDRRASQRARRGSWRDRSVVGWAGMRGAVSLAAALALPDGLPEPRACSSSSPSRSSSPRWCCRG